MAKKHKADDVVEPANVEVKTVKATQAGGAYVKVPGSEESQLLPVGRHEFDGLVVVVTP